MKVKVIECFSCDVDVEIECFLDENKDIEIVKFSQLTLLEETEDTHATVLTTILYR